MNTLEGQQEWCKRPRKLQKNDGSGSWYSHVRRMKEEHIVRRMLDVGIPGKRRRGWPNLRWKDACKRDMTAVGGSAGVEISQNYHLSAG